MFIGFDVGNTTTMLGIYDDDSVLPEKTCRFRTDKRVNEKALSDNIIKNIKSLGDSDEICAQITAAAFSSVVPEVSGLYHRTVKNLFGIDIFEIRYDSKLSIKINYRDKAMLGIDRIVNTETAFREHGPGCVVIDIGTAATYDVLTHDGVFDGGLIAPGIGTTIRTLAEAASNLPEIVFEKPENLIATDTVNAIKSGFFYGWISMIEGIVLRIEKFYEKKFQVILTGGFAEQVMSGLEIKAVLDPLLTMKGIKYIYNSNMK
ncbi:MAG TPA: type III pantothenate kinase [Spirochaetota bacterium]|nr:type III pantothenate kinase [Spirochaetota bacterium]HQO40149.1 type III pantothenate kinase [Spirochaetota bacterium]